MKSKIINLLILLLFLNSCSITEERDITTHTEPKDSEISQEIIGVEHIGGKYNLNLDIVEVKSGNRTGIMKKIRYEKDGEMIEPDMMLPDKLRPGFDWLRENTKEEMRVMSWWDYGHMIRSYSEREPVVDSPSREILAKTVSKHIGKSPDEIKCDSCASHETIQDVASLFISKEYENALHTMKKYSASLLYINKEDKFKSMSFYISLEKEPVDPNSEEFLETTVGKGVDGDEIFGFELVYEDGFSSIYQIKDFSAIQK